jgi:dihydrofolate reductase
MQIVLIAAMTADGLIGRDGRLPWHEPEDLRHFKRLTTGHAVIMGRRTHESIGRALPGRRNIVLSRNPAYRPAGQEIDACARAAPGTRLDVAHGLAEALELCRSRGEEKAFLIGGAEVFAEGLEAADEMRITLVGRGDAVGDTYFPKWDEGRWRLASAERSGRLEFRVYARAR